ncbi:hypothetical protein D9758_011066 [Tetrapyrgos nigripes]|uniref:NmrA-like domain-containing protein n=1 Tax=Tetrapyrgos nigripes TaxID=182062 RepID=A0A8H5CSF6_9AGAR|nr:hypothetical protein D9758_011066 [Tetrapyrgos nigripes]
MAPSRRIAVAGGKGGVGRHLVEGLLERRDTLDAVIVLSRSASSGVTFHGYTAPVIAVDYNNVASIESVLQEHQIDTLISAIYVSGDELITSQINMIKASLNVPSMRRFAPSEFGYGSENAVSVTEYYDPKRTVLKYLREAVEDSKGRSGRGLEYTMFACGVFMNYLGYENPRPDREKAYGYLQPIAVVFYFSQGKAVIPGDGKQKQWWTRGEDVGKFVAAAIQLDVWPEVFNMAGSVATGNEIVDVFERVTGKKLDITYWPKAEISAQLNQIAKSSSGPISSSGFDAPNQFMEKTFRESQLVLINQELPSNMNLNEATDVKPMGLEEYLKLWWGSLKN